ncbi:MAG: hypothetical protein V4466_09480 [Pseudomonadota bacterium]
MGLFNFITGSKAAPKGVKRLTTATLRKRLMATNDPTKPYRVRDGGPEGVDMVAEWKIVDAKWYEFFAKAGIKRSFDVWMKFDEAKGEVRAVDHDWTVEWRAGVPTLSFAAEAFRGQKWEKGFEMVYAFREDGTFGKVYSYNFDSTAIKNPIKEAVLAAGWGWRGVAFSKL